MDSFAVNSAEGYKEAELTTFVNGLLKQMQGRFQQMSDNIIARIDDMGQRIDELENGLQQLVNDGNPAEMSTK